MILYPLYVENTRTGVVYAHAYPRVNATARVETPPSGLGARISVFAAAGCTCTQLSAVARPTKKKHKACDNYCLTNAYLLRTYLVAVGIAGRTDQLVRIRWVKCLMKRCEIIASKRKTRIDCWVKERFQKRIHFLSKIMHHFEPSSITLLVKFENPYRLLFIPHKKWASKTKTCQRPYASTFR